MQDAEVNMLMNKGDILELSSNDLTCIWDFFCSLLQLEKHPLILTKSGNEKINHFVQSARKRLFHFLDTTLYSCKKHRDKFFRLADLKQFICMLRQDILESAHCQEYVCVCEYVEKCSEVEKKCQESLEILQSTVTEFSEFKIFSFDQNLLNKLSQTLSRLEKSDQQKNDTHVSDDDPPATNSYQSLVSEIFRKFSSFRAPSGQVGLLPNPCSIKVEWTCEGQKQKMCETFQIASMTVADLTEAVACKLVHEKILMPEDPQFFFNRKSKRPRRKRGPTSVPIQSGNSYSNPSMD